ncbi:bacteriohemerythrin [Geomonas sp.]|uniref:bacteriohemerythrin n=1 Tax=Geomonas sp. TaxID=2651584 RepID=UPI002B4898E7|nr:bacteriohemerythrin [Geomonas sp.]HJV34326.1 bacteriohemerythrin [Geomonas sp.]
MPIIEWNVTLLLGIPKIDKHHQHLVQVLNDTYHGFRDGSEVSLAVLDDMMTASSRNFIFEETLMAETRYPKLAQHKNEHVIFSRRLQELQNNRRQGRKITIELVWFLCNWVSHHIRETDGDFCRFLDGVRMRKRAEGEAD